MMKPEDYNPEQVGNGKLADGSYANPGSNLVRNFLDCIKSRKTPIVSLEDAHLSTNLAHLASISLYVNQSIKWDAEREVVTNCEKANEYLMYEYRSPWKI